VVYVDAKDLAEQGPEILAVLVGVIAGTAISVRDVEEAVGAKDEGSTVMVPVGLLEAKDFQLGGRVSLIGVVLADLEPRNNVCQPLRLQRLENAEIPVFPESGVEREPQETFLVGIVVVGDAIMDVEQNGRFRRCLFIGKSVDHTVLRGDKNAVRAVAGVR
jgi:hypothetical protein